MYSNDTFAQPVEVLLADAEDYRIEKMARSGARHRLIRRAVDEYQLWDRVIPILVEAAQRRDLSHQVCDTFVDNAPDWVFRDVYQQCPAVDAASYNRRARRLQLR